MAVVQNGLLYSADPADSTIGDLFVIVNQDENVTVAGSAGPDFVEVANYKGSISGYTIQMADGGDTVDLFSNRGDDLSTVDSFINLNQGDDFFNFDQLIRSTVFGGSGIDEIQNTNGFFGSAVLSSLIRLNDGDDFFNPDGEFASMDASTINGNAGIDRLNFVGNGTLTSNVIHGGMDQDFIDIIVGTNEVFRGNTVNGNKANDQITVDVDANDANTNIADNTIFGGQGTDTINASASTGSLYLSGDNGNDTITGGEGDDTITGGEGDDIVTTGGDGNDFINGNAGNDTITDGAGDDNVFGGAGNDTLIIQQGRDTVTGNLGSDLIQLGAFDNITDLIVQNNSDSIAASALNQTVGGVADPAGLTFANGVDLITGFEQGVTDGVFDRLSVQGDTNNVNIVNAAVDFSTNATAFDAGTVNVIYGTITLNADGTAASFLSAANGADSFVVVGNNGLMNINSNGFLVDNVQIVATDFA